ncbi:MAG: nickel-binding protein [Chthoniobacterales bacterium]
MPTYIDIHEIQGLTADAVAKAHEADLKKQGKYGVNYLKYWVNESCGKAFCLVHAPNAEAARQVHLEAHGRVAEKIIEVQPEIAECFLGGGEANAVGAAMLADGGPVAYDPAIRTVMFTDIVGSTHLTQRLGDDAAMEFVHLHDEIVRDALTSCKGREVKHTGDGIMASFVSAAGAVRCAARIQHALAHLTERRGHRLRVRVGGAAGEPVEKDLDIFGTTVQLAARLTAYAQPEQILVSNVVAELCIGKGLTFHSLGEVSLKGFDRSVHVQAVEWSNEVCGSSCPP